jgi:hypothetical protein
MRAVEGSPAHMAETQHTTPIQSFICAQYTRSMLLEGLCNADKALADLD